MSQSLQVRRYLQHLLTRAQSKATFSQRAIFLELFAGDGGIGRVMKSRGFAVLSLDIRNHALQDHLCPTFQSVVKGWLRGGVVGAIWLGTPCTTWSIARRPAIRDSNNLMGLPGLTDSQTLKLNIGNDTYLFSTQVIRLDLRHNTPVAFENPGTSMMWRAPHMCRLLGDDSYTENVCDRCQFGARWKKRTHIAMWNAGQCIGVQHTCHPRGRVCSKSHKPHVELSGKAPGGIHWTALAASYPNRFCRIMGQHWIDVIQNNKHIRLNEIYGVRPSAS